MGIFKKLREYKKSDYLSAHMPGHKSGNFLPPDLEEAFGKSVFEYDLTEVEGLDNLQNPQGVIKDTEKKIKKLTGAEKVYLLVNGSTSGLLSAIYTLGREEKIFVGGNAHQGVYNAMVIADSSPIFLAVETDDESGTELGVAPETLIEGIRKHPDCKVLILTLPNYYGIRYKYREILKIAKENNLRIIIDEAHGAHFNFMGKNYPNGIKIGGQVVVQSWHKSLPVFNQGSILLISKDLAGEPNKYNFRESVNIFQTTSPSYLIMSSIDIAADFLKDKEDIILDSADRWQNLYKSLSFKNLRIFKNLEEISDPFKLLVYSKKETKNLFKKIIIKKYKIQPEIVDEERVLFMLPLIFDQKLGDRIKEALLEVDFNLDLQGKLEKEKEPKREKIGKLQKTPKEMSFMDYKKLPLLESIGSLCGEKIMKYPPGVPLIYPGEILSEEIVCYLNRHKINYNLQDGIKIFRDQEN